jgi:hypothetical protein
MQKKFDTDVENTQDANDVKAVLCVKPHSRNTIVGLSLLGLSLIFKGQHCSKRNNRGDAQWSLKKRSSSKQFTISKEKIYRNLPITLVPAHSLWNLRDETLVRDDLSLRGGYVNCALRSFGKGA